MRQKSLVLMHPGRGLKNLPGISTFVIYFAALYRLVQDNFSFSHSQMNEFDLKFFTPKPQR